MASRPAVGSGRAAVQARAAAASAAQNGTSKRAGSSSERNQSRNSDGMQYDTNNNNEVDAVMLRKAVSIQSEESEHREWSTVVLLEML